MKQFTTSKNYPNETLIRIMNFYFLQKSEFQNQGNAKLIGLPGILSMSISQNNMMESTLFWKKIALLLLVILA